MGCFEWITSNFNKKHVNFTGLFHHFDSHFNLDIKVFFCSVGCYGYSLCQDLTTARNDQNIVEYTRANAHDYPRNHTNEYSGIDMHDYSGDNALDYSRTNAHDDTRGDGHDYSQARGDVHDYTEAGDSDYSTVKAHNYMVRNKHRSQSGQLFDQASPPLHLYKRTLSLT